MLDSLKNFLKKKQDKKRKHKQFLDIQKWQREMYIYKSRKEQEMH